MKNKNKTEQTITFFCTKDTIFFLNKATKNETEDEDYDDNAFVTKTTVKSVSQLYVIFSFFGFVYKKKTHSSSR